MRRLGVIVAAIAAAAGAQTPNASLAGDDQIVVTGRRPKEPCDVVRQVFVSPVGQPFRDAPDAPPPIARWFEIADANRDGFVDAAEMRADADRFFARIDRDHDGMVLPDEMALYERDVTPEVSVYERSAADRAFYAEARRRTKPLPYGTPVGAARFALLNVPHPLASADQDYDRAVTRAELEAVAAKAFAALAKGRDRLALADLPTTPQASFIARCKAQKKGRFR